jgi:hypothetical protein
MAEDAQTAPMKPQDTVIYLLGELKGQVGSLTESVNSSATQQAAVNAANEAEHAEFRKTLGIHDTAIAVLTDGKKTQQMSKSERTQRWMVYIALPTAVTALATIVYSVVNK